MCGIIAAHGETIVPLDAALDRLKHRGPDGQEIYHRPGAALGHTRLAVVDVAGGQQPMSNSTGQHWLVCNGEIYNHRQLRGEVADYPFKTHSDSEAILALAGRFSPAEIVGRLDGMFAFALFSEGDVLLARDRLGIKPLYYGTGGDTLYFASEIKALQPLTDEIHEFPAGHWFTPADGFVPYYDIAAVADEAVHHPTPSLSDIQACLQAAVRKRLMADVPLGVFLSGGLDSSIISALVRQDIADLHSFAVGMDGGEDLGYARMVARHLGTNHHEYIYTADEMIAALPQVIYYLESFDPALVRSAVPNYFLARLAAEHVTVALSGEGADELYSGYRYLNRFQDGEALQREMIAMTSELHNRNLQRLDRMTMAHGLEGRVPFLDPQFLAQAFAIPAEKKLHTSEQMEKWILRKAFEDLLPREVAWRTKEKFSKGAGSSHVFAGVAELEISHQQFISEAGQIFEETGAQIESKEALYYYRIFREFFGPAVIPLVGRSRSL